MKVLVLGGIEIAKVISQLDNLMVIDRSINHVTDIIYTIENDRKLFETKQSDFTPDRDYGWYRCFDKSNKKGNLK